MDDRPLTPPGSGSAPPPESPPGAPRRSHLLPLVVGVAVGAAAIAVAVILIRNEGTKADPPSATSTAAAPSLKIVFPEGFTRREMAERIVAVDQIAKQQRGITPVLSADEYLVETRRSQIPREFGAEEGQRSLEGFLFPATYEFTPDSTSQGLVELQVAAFRKAWAKVDLAKARKRNLTPYDVLIIASMIEGEVRVPRERRLVAAVVYNRLRAGMPLGIDATLRYGLGIPPDESISDSDLESNNPYNTRKHRGLPPTPINNPGLAAMKAAANPASVNYLYYARKQDCKSHFFTASFARFQQFLAGPRC